MDSTHSMESAFDLTGLELGLQELEDARGTRRLLDLGRPGRRRDRRHRHRHGGHLTITTLRKEFTMFDTAVADGFIDTELELGLQELESLEAPSFWSGIKQSVALTIVIVSAVT